MPAGYAVAYRPAAFKPRPFRPNTSPPPGYTAPVPANETAQRAATVARVAARLLLRSAALPVSISLSAALYTDRKIREREQLALIPIPGVSPVYNPAGSGWQVLSDCLGGGNAWKSLGVGPGDCLGDFAGNFFPDFDGSNPNYTGEVLPYGEHTWQYAEVLVQPYPGALPGDTPQYLHCRSYIQVTDAEAVVPKSPWQPIPLWVPGAAPSFNPTPVEVTHALPEPLASPTPTRFEFTDRGVFKTPAPSTRSKPKKKEKERKTRDKSKKGAFADKLMGVLNQGTELVDVLDAVYDAIPIDKCPTKAAAEELIHKGGPKHWDPNHVVKSKKSKRYGQKGAWLRDRPYGAELEKLKAEAVYKCAKAIDLDTALFNIVWSQMIEDFIWAQLGIKGRAGDGKGRYGGNLGGNQVAFNGPKDAASIAKETSQRLKNAEAAVRSWFEGITGNDLTPTTYGDLHPAKQPKAKP